ncbi:hypothetical protein AAGW05_05850 [Arthrobacter sp. LAPM80]|uniref:hypothetical protein n=1 Tax=Arthrobacter sp. LAPM80 TaxID=3141788 RepID=UPI00398B58FA
MGPPVKGLVHAHHVASAGGPNTWDGLDGPEAMYLVPCDLAILAGGVAAGTVAPGTLPTPTSARQSGPPGEVMAAVDHLLVAGKHYGLDEKTLLSLLQGRLNQQGK